MIMFPHLLIVENTSTDVVLIAKVRPAEFYMRVLEL